MKIYIKSSDSNFAIKLYFPLLFLRFGIKIVCNFYDDLKIYRKEITKICKIIKEYIKINGHFVLIDIESNNDKVYIKV